VFFVDAHVALMALSRNSVLPAKPSGVYQSGVAL
jgi:hypothetical protein